MRPPEFNPSISVGTVTGPRTALLGMVPVASKRGAFLSAIRFLVANDVTPDQNNYFLLRFGVLINGYFQVIYEYPVLGVVTGSVENVVSFESPLFLAAGSLFAVRIEETGNAPTLEALSFVPERTDLTTTEDER